MDGGDRDLGVDGRLDGAPRRGEDEVQPVAGRAALLGPVRGERLPDEPVVIGEHVPIALAQGLEQARRTLDVREHQGDGARR